ncbi:MAG: transporter ATP-binding protein [Rhodospirillales bacterium]|nr:transporter ATP-binding protein [Rhodospirillales bacterium]
MTELLRVEGLTAGYEDGTVVIEGISLSLGEGSTLALLGRNGVGKTTLLASIMGLTKIPDGRVTLQGRDITRRETHTRAFDGIGYVPQEREIFPSLTVEENLAVARARKGAWTLEAVYELFPRLAERRRNYGNQLSGGEQQMLAVGRALISNPVLLLLDEPFEGLAPVIVDQLAAAFDRIRNETGIATILVEHHAEIALSLAEQAIVLDRGQIVWAGDSATLLHDRAMLASLIGIDDAVAHEA